MVAPGFKERQFRAKVTVRTYINDHLSTVKVYPKRRIFQNSRGYRIRLSSGPRVPVIEMGRKEFLCEIYTKSEKDDAARLIEMLQE